MRERIKGGSKPVQEAVKQTCPYLGLAHDQFGHLPEPSSEHRCYLYMQRERIDQSHQERFCLTTSYLNCPWLMVSPAAAGQGDSPWQRFSESLRERFDEMERVTMRNRWPRAFVAVLIFIAQMTAKAAVETWRVCAPVVGPFLERRWIELRAWALRSWLKFKNRSARPAIQKAAPRSTTVSTPAAAPSTLHFETVADEVSLGPAVEPTPVTNGAHVQSSGEGVARPVVETHTLPGFKWECANCFTYNPPSVTFCQHCGRLSTHVEEELLAKEDFFTLDGLKALMAGDEDGAHRYFTLATQANPQSELAWRWRSRTAATLNEVISCLEQMLKAIPSSEEAQADLELAKLRRDREQALAEARAAAEAPEPIPTGPSLLERTVGVVRRLALEAASIPGFALGLFWLGKPVLEALASVGYYGLGPIMPVFIFPTLMIHLPAALVEPLLPSTVPAGEVVTVALAVWYFLLAFSVSDGSTGSRVAGIVSGAVSLFAMRYVAANGEAFFLAAAFLFVLTVVGKGGPREEDLGTSMMSTRAA